MVTKPADATAKGIDLGTSQLGSSYQVNQKVSSAWLPNGGTITQGFGVWENVPQFGINAPHMGIDIAGKRGDPIMLPEGMHATVQEAGWDPFGAGNFLKLALDNGSTVQLFHMQNLNVHQGQDLSGGVLLGHLDSTGDSTGDHVHFQVDSPSGVAVDPWSVIQHVVGSVGGSSSDNGVAGFLGLGNVNDFFGHLVSPGHNPCSTPSGEVGILRVVDAVSCPQNWWKVLFTGTGIALIIFGAIVYFFKEEKQVGQVVVQDVGAAAA